MNPDSVRQRKFDDNKSENVKQNISSKRSLDEDKPKGWCEFVVSVILAGLLLFVIVLIILPCPIEPQTYSVQKAPEFKGVLAPNTLLRKANRLYINEVKGPESIVVEKDHIYTGTMDGKILDIFRGEIKVLATLGQPPCGNFENEPTCGRPLGMKLDREGYLIVADAYLGLFRVNVATGDVHTLFNSNQKVNGLEPKFLNDLILTKDGTIYITDSSTRWDRRNHPYAFLEGDDTGRLLKYNPNDGTMAEVVSGFRFANGLELSPKEDFLFMCETTMSRINKYYLDGPKKGQTDIWVDNLPGIPDNIRKTPRGTYWVGMAAARQSEKFSFLDFGTDKPWLRSIITKILPMQTIVNIIPKYGLLIELNSQGEIIRSLHDPDGQKIPSVSEAEEHNGVIYLGSFNLPFISKLYVRDLN